MTTQLTLFPEIAVTPAAAPKSIFASAFDHFTLEQRKQIIAWNAKHTYEETIELIQKEFSITVSKSSLGRFHDRTAFIRIIEDSPDTHAAADEILLHLATPNNHHTKLTAAALAVLEQTAFKLALTCADKPAHLDQLNRINLIICRARNTAVRERHATVQEKKCDLRTRELDLKELHLNLTLNRNLNLPTPQTTGGALSALACDPSTCTAPQTSSVDSVNQSTQPSADATPADPRLSTSPQLTPPSAPSVPSSSVPSVLPPPSAAASSKPLSTLIPQLSTPSDVAQTACLRASNDPTQTTGGALSALACDPSTCTAPQTPSADPVNQSTQPSADATPADPHLSTSPQLTPPSAPSVPSSSVPSVLPPPSAAASSKPLSTLIPQLSTPSAPSANSSASASIPIPPSASDVPAPSPEGTSGNSPAALAPGNTRQPTSSPEGTADPAAHTPESIIPNSPDSVPSVLPPPSTAASADPSEDPLSHLEGLLNGTIPPTWIPAEIPCDEEETFLDIWLRNRNLNRARQNLQPSGNSSADVAQTVCLRPSISTSRDVHSTPDVAPAEQKIITTPNPELITPQPSPPKPPP